MDWFDEDYAEDDVSGGGDEIDDDRAYRELLKGYVADIPLDEAVSEAVSEEELEFPEDDLFVYEGAAGDEGVEKDEEDEEKEFSEVEDEEEFEDEFEDEFDRGLTRREREERSGIGAVVEKLGHAIPRSVQAYIGKIKEVVRTLSCHISDKDEQFILTVVKQTENIESLNPLLLTLAVLYEMKNRTVEKRALQKFLKSCNQERTTKDVIRYIRFVKKFDLLKIY